jgi:hypothetical protein
VEVFEGASSSADDARVLEFVWRQGVRVTVYMYNDDMIRPLMVLAMT